MASDLLPKLDALCADAHTSGIVLTVEDVGELIAAAREADRLRAEADGPAIVFMEADRGPAGNVCTGCGERRDEPHSWKECHASLEKREASVLDAFTSGSTEEKLQLENTRLRSAVRTLREKLSRHHDCATYDPGTASCDGCEISEALEATKEVG